MSLLSKFCFQLEKGLSQLTGISLATSQDFFPKINMTEEDFDVITNNGSLLNEQGQVLHHCFCSRNQVLYLKLIYLGLK